ncbi:MAG: DUF4231 domain-containing protein [Myxococcales bacterium]|nr:DUF4231 domain-containing protein [Myxococcales bacterium]
MPTSAPQACQTVQFPDLYAACETVSAECQQTFLAVCRAELAALVFAAALAELPRDVLWGIGPKTAWLFFAVALVLRVSGVGRKAEKRWYDARAAAESIKSAAWQYAVCGEAFRRDDDTAESRFTDLLRDVLIALPNLNVPATPGGCGVTSEMNALRHRSVDDRISVYVRERIDDQLLWYAQKAIWNRTRAKWWLGTMISLEAIAVILGLFRALEVVDVDWLGILSAAAASVGAWQQVKNYSVLSEAYSVTSHEVQLVKGSTQPGLSESEWAQAAHDAEAAFSREHKLWVARRQGPTH